MALPARRLQEERVLVAVASPDLVPNTRISMIRTFNPYLISAAILSALAALLHLGCIAFGAPWYRFLGAGEGMAQLAAAGHWYPDVAALVIAGMLSVWSLYALSGAGILPRLPLLRVGLCVITAIYLIRGAAFPLLMPYFPGNSAAFWATTSAICLVIGILYLLGLRRAWTRL